MTSQQSKSIQLRTELSLKSLIFALIVFMLISTIDCYIKRTQYHEQGLHGPKSYKFGYTTGDYKNPQERHEESDGYGHVRGWYSYIDPYGKKQVIHYEAHPKLGFKVLNNYHKPKDTNYKLSAIKG